MRNLIPLLLLSSACIKPMSPLSHCEQAITTVVPTEDGASIRLHRHEASGPPVLVVHGLASSGQFWDLSEERSIAGALNRAGFDAWVLDLRGHGGHALDAEGAALKPGWTLDDYGRYDLPAAIDHVRRITGYDKVGYVGHSMGGMVAAIYNAWHGDDALAGLVVVGSPVDFSHPDRMLELAGQAMKLGTLLPAVHAPFFARTTAGWDSLPLKADELLFTATNLDPDTRKLMFHHGVSTLTRGELRQLSRVVDTGRFGSMDGQHDYLDELAELDVPLLVIAGRADAIAPADRVYPFYARAGSAEKRWELAGRENGYGADYGHLDLAAGILAPTEIHPLITGWFEGRWEAPEAGLAEGP